VKAALALLVLVMLVSSGRASGAPTGDDLSDFAFRPHPGAPLPLASRFVDEQGRVVALGEFFAGKPVVLVLDYLRCKTLCGLTLDHLVAGLDAIPLDGGRDFQVVVISIDPRDTPADVATAKVEHLAAYHHTTGVDGWHFLTGSEAAIQEVADIVGFPHRYDAALDQYIHPAGFIVAGGDGRISRYLAGVNTEAPDLRAALDDAAAGKSYSLVTRLLLLCHGDTPQLGRYSLAIEAAFIAANVAAGIGGIAVFAAIRRRHG
jgi:protein SCO1